MMFLADFMGCNDQKSSRNGIFVTRNNLGSLYTSFSWVLELIGNLRRNYESVPVFALRGHKIRPRSLTVGRGKIIEGVGICSV